VRISERLYQSRAGELAQFWSRGASVSSAAVTVAANVRNELEGRLIVLTNLSASYAPGAAQTIAAGYFELIPPNGAAAYVGQYLVLFQNFAAVATACGINWSGGDVVVPPLWYVRASGAFSAGAAANLTLLTAMGYAIPIGSLAAV
jgi:hypothetical protein